MLLSKGSLKEEDKEPFLGPFSWYLECFSDLSTCRSTMSLSPIPFTAIIEYVKLYDIEDTEDFISIVRLLDSVYIEFSEEQNGRDKN